MEGCMSLLVVRWIEFGLIQRRERTQASEWIGGHGFWKKKKIGKSRAEELAPPSPSAQPWPPQPPYPSTAMASLPRPPRRRRGGCSPSGPWRHPTPAKVRPSVRPCFLLLALYLYSRHPAGRHGFGFVYVLWQLALRFISSPCCVLPGEAAAVESSPSPRRQVLVAGAAVAAAALVSRPTPAACESSSSSSESIRRRRMIPSTSMTV